MDKLSVHIIKPGMLTTVQDIGRYGYQKYGVPKSGALDLSALKIANWLVGNQLNNPVLELTILGPKIEFNNDCLIAIAGADLSPKINGLDVASNKCLKIVKGDELSFGRMKIGCRAYLAIGGNWKIQEWLGSQSAFILKNENITPESVIKKGRVIEIETSGNDLKRIIPKGLNFHFGNKIKVMKGPEFTSFSKEFIAYFFSKTFYVSTDSNRMGYRLEPKIENYEPMGIISSGIVPGTIQITHAGQPIILLSDAQTIGGYPRIVNVVSADLDQLAQKKPGDKIEFALVDLKEAQQAIIEKNKQLSFLKNV